MLNRDFLLENDCKCHQSMAIGRVLSRNICLGGAQIREGRLVGWGFSPENFEFQIARDTKFTACYIREGSLMVWGEASPLPSPPLDRTLDILYSV